MEVIDFGKPVKTNIQAVFDNNGNNLPEIINSAGNSLFSATYPVIYPEDFEGNTLHEKIMNAMEFVKISGGGFEVNFSKSSEYVVSSAIEIPSNTTIKIENCTIRMADNIVDNMFRSANIIPSQSSPLGHCENSEDMEWLENIQITGNNATLVMEDNASVYGADNVGWRGTTICLEGVRGFEVSGLNINKNICFGIYIVGGCYGTIHDITFNTTRLNGDGVDITAGAHDISVYNIEGITWDDTIAIGNFGAARYIARPQEVNIPIIPTKYDYRKFGTDTYNIYVKDINARSAAHVFILITGTYQVYNISAANLSDKYDGSATCNAVVKIYGGQYNGDYSYDLIHNCSIMNVKGYNCLQAAVWLKQGLIENGRIFNVQVPSGDLALKNESGTDIANYNMQVVEGENLT